MLNQADFEKVIADSVKDYPTIAPLYQAQDPRILQPLKAMAAMFSMLSSQIDISMMEVFEKTRNGTILADASMRGIIPKGKPCNGVLTVINGNNTDFDLTSGRTLTDSAGNSWIVLNGVKITAGNSYQVDISQLVIERRDYVIDQTMPFYAIEIKKPETNPEAHLVAIEVNDADGFLTFSDRYVNIMPDERIFHVEADERGRIFIRFGLDGVVGFQPPTGHNLTITLHWTNGGAVMPEFESPFNFDYLSSPSDIKIKMTYQSTISAGVDPLPIGVLRDLARYPSTYDHNAVFLGEFDFLLRRHFPELAFIAVWNEAIEEKTRGADVNNINRLFVSFAHVVDFNALPVEEDHEVDFRFLTDAEYTKTHHDIITTIAKADSSYRVRFVQPVVRFLHIEVIASVSRVHQTDAVKSQIEQAIIKAFGVDAETFGKRSKEVITVSDITQLLNASIQALAVKSDLRVMIKDDHLTIKPEVWYAVSKDSLSVFVSNVKIDASGWH